MATITYQQLTEKVPAIGIFEQPFLFNFEALVRAAASPSSEIRQLLDQAILEATGTRVLWWQSYGSSVFFSKDQDATHPTGIRGRKIRVFGENMAKFTMRGQGDRQRHSSRCTAWQAPSAPFVRSRGPLKL
jgi:C4-dicarboxylate-binding protein DctP